MDSSKTIKFLHFNNGSQKGQSRKELKGVQNRTAAVVALSPNTIEKLANEFVEAVEKLTITMLIGVTFVSPDDNYNKEQGRVNSVNAMKETEMVIEQVNISPTHIEVYLAPHQGIALILRLNKKTGFSTVLGHLHCEDIRE